MFASDLATSKFIELKIIKKMSNKSKFLKSATLAITVLALASGLASCKMIHKVECAEKEPSVKEEKVKDSSKTKGEKTKEAKVVKTKKAKTEKAKAVTKKAE
jgi:hypothetical protein